MTPQLKTDLNISSIIPAELLAESTALALEIQIRQKRIEQINQQINDLIHAEMEKE